MATGRKPALGVADHGPDQLASAFAGAEDDHPLLASGQERATIPPGAHDEPHCEHQAESDGPADEGHRAGHGVRVDYDGHDGEADERRDDDGPPDVDDLLERAPGVPDGIRADHRSEAHVQEGRRNRVPERAHAESNQDVEVETQSRRCVH